MTAAFDIHAPLCPFIAAAVQISDPGHPARTPARNYNQAFAARLTDTAHEPGAANREQLGEQLALMLDGASARNRVLNTETFATASAVAAVLVDNAIPRQRHRPAQALSSSTATMTMTPAGAAPHVPAVAPLPSTLARSKTLTASRSRADRKASSSLGYRAER